MGTIKRIIKSGSIGKAVVVGSIYAVGAVVTKLTADFYRRSLKDSESKVKEKS